MIRILRRLLFGDTPRVYPPIKAGEHIAAMPTERPTFNEWATHIRRELNRMKS